MGQEVLPLASVAMRLRIRYHRARDLVLSGELEGMQGDTGRWFVTVSSIERYEAALANPQATAQAL
jgi:hypothetical protein